MVVSLAFGLICFGCGAKGVLFGVICALLVNLSYIDLNTRRLPNKLVLLVAFVGFAGVCLSELTDVVVFPLPGGDVFCMVLLGVCLGVLVPLALSAACGALGRNGGVGSGDVKLLGALGIVFGPDVLVVLAAACLFALVSTSVFSFVRQLQAKLKEDEECTDKTNDLRTSRFGPFLGELFAFGPFVTLAVVFVSLFYR